MADQQLQFTYDINAELEDILQDKKPAPKQ